MLRECIAVGLLLAACYGVSAEPMHEPAEIGSDLLAVYGSRLDDVAYIPALAVHCRGRFANLSGKQSYADQVQQLLAPYAAGIRSPKTNSHVAIAGHLAFVGQDDQRLTELIIAAAAAVPPVKPEEMSDAAFMCGPILAEAGRAAKDRKYFAAAIKYLAGISRLRQRDDGLYAHGHLCDAAWGRGNGFPSVGAAWCLSILPDDIEGRQDLLESHRRHLAALLKHQDATGMWHQVIDLPDSQPEFTCTAMTGFAMQRGITRGWLDANTYEAAVDRAWQAIRERVEPGGKLLGVCESTGTQPSSKAYLDRRIIDGIDQRGGAMALLFVTERMAADAKAKKTHNSNP